MKTYFLKLSKKLSIEIFTIKIAIATVRITAKAIEIAYIGKLLIICSFYPPSCALLTITYLSVVVSNLSTISGFSLIARLRAENSEYACFL